MPGDRAARQRASARAAIPAPRPGPGRMTLPQWTSLTPNHRRTPLSARMTDRTRRIGGVHDVVLSTRDAHRRMRWRRSGRSRARVGRGVSPLTPGDPIAPGTRRRSTRWVRSSCPTPQRAAPPPGLRPSPGWERRSASPPRLLPAKPERRCGRREPRSAPYVQAPGRTGRTRRKRPSRQNRDECTNARNARFTRQSGSNRLRRVEP